MVIAATVRLADEDFASSVLHNLIHEIYQVRILIGFLHDFSEVFDRIIDEILHVLAGILAEIEGLEVLLNVDLALILDVWLVDELEGSDHDI